MGISPVQWLIANGTCALIDVKINKLLPLQKVEFLFYFASMLPLFF